MDIGSIPYEVAHMANLVYHVSQAGSKWAWTRFYFVCTYLKHSLCHYKGYILTQQPSPETCQKANISESKQRFCMAKRRTRVRDIKYHEGITKEKLVWKIHWSRISVNVLLYGLNLIYTKYKWIFHSSLWPDSWWSLIDLGVIASFAKHIQSHSVQVY